MKTLRDTGIVFERSFRQIVRNPVWVFVVLTQPLFYLFLFAPLLKKVTTAQGFPPGGAYNVFVPGLLVQLALFGSAFVGFAVIAELRFGVIERLQVTPISRAALLLGRVCRDLVALTVQAIVIMVIALPFGLSINILDGAVTLALLILIGVTFSSVSYALGLKLRTEDALAPLLNGVVVPVLLLSGILLPLSLAPAWLRRLADVNPLSHVVAASRALFNGDLWSVTVLRGSLVGTAMAALAVYVGVRAFRQAAA
ncbi:MAG TPA: ABC transporter permease [Acidimicrobiales bacterium]|jgi:ABC-2 type transport system permease protein|nr:ABC transporter permease [Acidimicrobiales bacterium]